MGVLVANSAPADNPSGSRIAYLNRISSADDSAANPALTPNTYERWTPSAGAVSVKFQLDDIIDADYIGLAALSLLGETLTLSTAETVGGSMVVVESVLFESNGAKLITFDMRTVAEIEISGTLIADSEIGVVAVGKALQMPVNIYGGHSPQSLSRSTEYQSTISDTGQFLGRTVIRKGTSATYQWQHLDPNWYRESFDPFVQSASALPFFIQWRPDRYPEEVEYAHTTSDIKPDNMAGGHSLMSVSISVRGHSDV